MLARTRFALQLAARSCWPGRSRGSMSVNDRYRPPSISAGFRSDLPHGPFLARADLAASSRRSYAQDAESARWRAPPQGSSLRSSRLMCWARRSSERRAGVRRRRGTGTSRRPSRSSRSAPAAAGCPQVSRFASTAGVSRPIARARSPTPRIDRLWRRENVAVREKALAGLRRNHGWC
jgi:hypothetical protein